MRTLDAAYALVLEADPDTSLTKHAIRALAVSGRIQAVKVGAKRLINVDWLLEQLAINPASLSVETSEPSLSTARQPSGVRPIRIAK
jgi:hypothetical protein